MAGRRSKVRGRDSFHSFAQLAAATVEGKDFAIEACERGTRLLVMAPHGGGIEPGTSEVARALAADRLSLYCFEGLKERGNDRLHLTSTRFDEPAGLRLIAHASVVVAIHACADEGSLVYVGGLDETLKGRVLEALHEAGFRVLRDNTHHAGNSPRNLCNRGTSGRGLQLELSHGLRRSMFGGLSRPGRASQTRAFAAFAAAVGEVLAEYEGMTSAPRAGSPQEN